MSIFEQIELEDKIMKICKNLHDNLCKDNEDSEDSIMTPDEVNQLEPIEALKHMTEAIKDLLSHQRNIKIFREHKSFHNSEAVQSTLQKLESDVREHIKIENQLKLYCENYEALIEENESELKNIEKTQHRQLEELEAENKALKTNIKALEEDLSKLKLRKTEVKENDLSREPESEVAAESDHKNIILADKVIKVKRLKEITKNKEFLCKELTKENKEMMDLIKKVESDRDDIDFPTSSYYQIRYKEKCREIAMYKKKIKALEKGPKSQSPFLNTIRHSASPLPKRVIHKEGKKKSPLRSNSRSAKILYKTMNKPERNL